VKNSEGDTILEIPVTAGVIGTVVLPAVAAVGVIAGLANDWTVEVYRDRLTATSGYPLPGDPA